MKIDLYQNDLNPSGGFRPLDIALLGYAAIELLLVTVFMIGRDNWALLIWLYVAVIALTLFMGFSPVAFSGRFWKTIRLGYPMLLFLMLYEAVGLQIQLLHNSMFDWQIHGFEKSLFGNDPAFLLQPYMQIWMNEIMSLSYMSYFFFLPVAAIILISKNNFRAFEQLSFSTSFTFFICYLLFIIYPVTGPRFYLENIYYLPLIGPFVTPLLAKIVAHGGLYGGAMPSSHCAVAFVVVWVVAKEYRWARKPFGIVFVLLCMATVYGRFHYISDVVVGIAIGIIGLSISRRVQQSFWSKIIPPVENTSEPPLEPASIGTHKSDIANS